MGCGSFSLWDLPKELGWGRGIVTKLDLPKEKDLTKEKWEKWDQCLGA